MSVCVCRLLFEIEWDGVRTEGSICESPLAFFSVCVQRLPSAQCLTGSSHPTKPCLLHLVMSLEFALTIFVSSRRSGIKEANWNRQGIAKKTATHLDSWRPFVPLDERTVIWVPKNKLDRTRKINHNFQDEIIRFERKLQTTDKESKRDSNILGLVIQL